MKQRVWKQEGERETEASGVQVGEAKKQVLRVYHSATPRLREEAGLEPAHPYGYNIPVRVCFSGKDTPDASASITEV